VAALAWSVGGIAHSNAAQVGGLGSGKLLRGLLAAVR